MFKKLLLAVILSILVFKPAVSEELAVWAAVWACKTQANAEAYIDSRIEYKENQRSVQEWFDDFVQPLLGSRECVTRQGLYIVRLLYNKVGPDIAPENEWVGEAAWAVIKIVLPESEYQWAVSQQMDTSN